MDILDNYFGEEIQKYIQTFEYGKVYSNPYAKAFNPVSESINRESGIPDVNDSIKPTNTVS